MSGGRESPGTSSRADVGLEAHWGWEMKQGDIWEKVREIEEERAAAKRAQEAADRRAESEREKERQLLREAQDWEAAQTIRRYLKALRAAKGGLTGEWLTWAESLADRLDPLGKRLSLLSGADAENANPMEPPGQDRPINRP